MPNKIQKTLQDYLSKIKHTHPPHLRLPFHTKNWVLTRCKHPRTPSFALEYRTNESNHHDDNNNNHHNHNHNHNNKETNEAATLADVDRFLVENFKSLYLKDSEENQNNNTNTKRVVVSDQKGNNDEECPKLGSVMFESPRLVEMPRDLCGSSRFFVKPGFSGSLLEDAHALTKYDESPTSTTTSLTTLNGSSSNSNDHNTLPDDCIALLTYSPSPYEEFRRSMQEVVEARFKNRERVSIDWDFMEELLFCYLNLNDKKSHKFILNAFVDLVTVLRRNMDAVPAKPCSVRTVRSTGREFRKKTKQVTLDFGSS